MTEESVAARPNAPLWGRRFRDRRPELRQIASEALRSIVLIAIAMVLILVLFPAALRAASPV
jgi:hypothetical protein